MPDEFKTLLKIEGDASGAKRAAEEATKAAESLGEKTTVANSEMAKAGEASTSAMEDGEAAATVASESADGAAIAFNLAGKEAAQMRLMMSRLSPEAARIFDIFKHGQGVLSQVFSGAANEAIALAAAVIMIKAAWDQVAESAAKARAETEKVAEIGDKIRARERGRTEGVSEALARAGIVSEAATGKARSIEGRMLRQGFGIEAIRKVLPYAVDQAGQQVLTDEEIANLAAVETYGKGQLEFEKPKQMEATLRRARRAVGTDAAIIAKWRTAIEERRKRLAEDAAQMNYEAMAKVLAEGPEAIPEDQLKQVIEDIRSVARGEEVSTEGLSLFWSGSDRLIWETRQREAARRARALGIVGNEEAISAATVAPDPTLTGWGRQMTNRPVVVNNYNHGTINNGKPSTQPVQRAVVP